MVSRNEYDRIWTRHWRRAFELHRTGISQGAVARKLHISRDTVRRAIEVGGVRPLSARLREPERKPRRKHPFIHAPRPLPVMPENRMTTDD